MKKLLIFIQFSLVAVAIGFAIFWAYFPEGPFESWLGVATTLLLALEVVRQMLVRQFWPWDVKRDADSRFQRQLDSSGDLRDLLNRALDELEKITATDYNQIFLNNQAGYEGRLLAVADSMPKHKQRYRIASYEGLLGSVYADGRTLNARDVRQLEGYFEAVPETRSEIVVPIKSNGSVLGVVNSESENLGHFTDTIREQVEQLADALGHLLPKFGYNRRVPENELLWIQKDLGSSNDDHNEV